jgi:hypothetical protein
MPSDFRPAKGRKKSGQLQAPGVVVEIRLAFEIGHAPLLAFAFHDGLPATLLSPRRLFGSVLAAPGLALLSTPFGAAFVVLARSAALLTRALALGLFLLETAVPAAVFVRLSIQLVHGVAPRSVCETETRDHRILFKKLKRGQRRIQ